MSERVEEKRRHQSGEIMLEASIIMVSVLILLMVMLSLVFFYYQESMMSSIANEIAAEVARNYKYADLELGSNEITVKDIKEINMFRMNFGRSKMEKKYSKSAKDYAAWRIGLSTLGFNSKDADVECKIVNSGIGRAYVEVTVSQETDFFLSGILDYAGITEADTLFSATAYAECVDMVGYTSMVNFTQYTADKLGVFSDFADLYSSLKDLIKKIE